MWKDHPEHPSLIKVSNDGKVFDKRKNKILNQWKNRHQKNELVVSLRIDGKSKNFLVKKLVAETFCKKEKGCDFIFRINDNLEDNSCKNLYWGKKYEDLSNRKFNRLTVGKKIKKDKNNVIQWECFCDCGNKLYVYASALKNGKTKSCGCLQKEHYLSSPGKKHGLHGSKEYKIWDAMIQRCHNQNNKAYHNYGGRGIFVCSEWKNSFKNFYNDMGPRPSDKHSIERKNNNKGYDPENCIWADKYTQANNTSRNKYFSLYGKTLTLTQWSRELGVSYDRLRDYIRRGYNFQNAVNKLKE